MQADHYCGGMTQTHPASPPDPMSAPALRWGVLGAGGIASVFTEAVTRYTQSAVVAVGSRAQARIKSDVVPRRILVEIWGKNP